MPAIDYPSYVGVEDDCSLTKCERENRPCGVIADAGKCEKCFVISRYLSTMMLANNLCAFMKAERSSWVSEAIPRFDDI
jgi:hypothetical protein